MHIAPPISLNILGPISTRHSTSEAPPPKMGCRDAWIGDRSALICVDTRCLSRIAAAPLGRRSLARAHLSLHSGNARASLARRSEHAATLLAKFGAVLAGCWPTLGNTAPKMAQPLQHVSNTSVTSEFTFGPSLPKHGPMFPETGTNY